MEDAIQIIDPDTGQVIMDLSSDQPDRRFAVEQLMLG